MLQLFHTRYALHKRAYQHRICLAVELMLAEALILANPFLFFPGRDGQPRRMSECPTDLHAYWRLGEYVVQQIENSSDEVIVIVCMWRCISTQLWMYVVCNLYSIRVLILYGLKRADTYIQYTFLISCGYLTYRTCGHLVWCWSGCASETSSASWGRWFCPRSSEQIYCGAGKRPAQGTLESRPGGKCWLSSPRRIRAAASRG